MCTVLRLVGFAMCGVVLVTIQNLFVGGGGRIVGVNSKSAESMGLASFPKLPAQRLTPFFCIQNWDTVWFKIKGKVTLVLGCTLTFEVIFWAKKVCLMCG